jgi:hypothetical protein
MAGGLGPKVGELIFRTLKIAGHLPIPQLMCSGYF